MKRVCTAVVMSVLIAAGASSCDDSPTAPEPNSVTFTATLSPANEVPPVTNADASGSGTVTITLNLTRGSAGVITAATANFQSSLTGFVAGTALSLAHIHTGAAGVAGGVVVDTGLAPGQVVLTTGAGSFTRDAIPVTAEMAQSIIATPSAFYFNVHTALTPTGAVRGQLVKQ
jgi:hypothetical protein